MEKSLDRAILERLQVRRSRSPQREYFSLRQLRGGAVVKSSLLPATRESAQRSLTSSLVLYEFDCFISDVHGCCVVGIKPIHALPEADLSPLACHRNRHRILVGQRRAKNLAAIFVRFAHNSSGALPSYVFVTDKRRRWIIKIFLYAGRNDIRILDRHHCTLTEEWQRRMASIPQQRDTSLRPAHHRASDHQRPLIARIEPIDEGLNVGMPVTQIVSK